ncbi:septal ring lytic transglycosylase RlpA family protein [Agaribacterium haliotis]|uniref:septal ring lytic transglycosylase RlpA family protein n=1 Tax=Agaribacterium haliotis TaxID=2013869 RepID=UPI00130438F9|nr:septal ring lytic transglycosylase RlpA family protein [Agaribacterium haliotis]
MSTVLCAAFLLVACSTQPGAQNQTSSASEKDEYAHLRDIIPTAEKDSGPKQEIDMSHVPDAVPRYEKRRRAGNISPYKVKGKVYHVMDEGSGYAEVGIASWYGNKFHGNLTSNGETYDMYAMTAAHKTLPLPCYVKVTNLANNKTVVVRVNDRGPFAHGRIIDLSYAAAQKLGYTRHGTATVKVEHIEILEPTEDSGVDVLVASPKHEQETAETTATTTANTAANTAANPKAPLASSPLATPAVADTAGVKKAEPAPGAELKPYLQVGAFSSEAAALTKQFQVATMTQWPVQVEAGVNASEQAIYRVNIGPLPDEKTLLIVKRALVDKGLAEAHRVLK